MPSIRRSLYLNVLCVMRADRCCYLETSSGKRSEACDKGHGYQVSISLGFVYTKQHLESITLPTVHGGAQRVQYRVTILSILDRVQLC